MLTRLEPLLSASGVIASGLRPAKDLIRWFASLCAQFALRLTSRTYAHRRGVTIVFAPHQDDETHGCGALIARKRTAGWPVHVVFITDGAASHPNHPLIPPAAIAAIRLQEARQALAIVGADSATIHFLQVADSTLDRLAPDCRETLVARLAALLAHVQPDEIFLPCQADGSSEHRAAFGFVIDAIERTTSSAIIWEYPVWLWWNPSALLAQLVSSRGRHRALTEDYCPIKRRVLACYRSQLEPLPPEVQPALPRDFLRVLDPGAEYFFRIAPPVRSVVSATPTTS